MGFSHSRSLVRMARVVSPDEAIRALKESRAPMRETVREPLEVYHIPGLLALQFWSGEELVSVHFASGQSAHCEMTVTMSHCDSAGAKTQVFKVIGFKNLPSLCAQVAELICSEQHCLDLKPVVEAVRTLAHCDELGVG